MFVRDNVSEVQVFGGERNVTMVLVMVIWKYGDLRWANEKIIEGCPTPASSPRTAPVVPLQNPPPYCFGRPAPGCGYGSLQNPGECSRGSSTGRQELAGD